MAHNLLCGPCYISGHSAFASVLENVQFRLFRLYIRDTRCIIKSYIKRGADYHCVIDGEKLYAERGKTLSHREDGGDFCRGVDSLHNLSSETSLQYDCNKSIKSHHERVYF